MGIDGLTKGLLLKESLGMGNTISVNIRGKSMEPFIPEGLSLLVKSADLNTVGRGDIILFISEGEVIAHRFFKKVKKDNNVLLKVKADSTATFDSLIRPDDLIGKAVSIKTGKRLISLDNPIMSLLGFFVSYITLFTGYLNVIARRSRSNLAMSIQRLSRPPT